VSNDELTELLVWAYKRLFELERGCASTTRSRYLNQLPRSPFYTGGIPRKVWHDMDDETRTEPPAKRLRGRTNGT
jgi:hypothetical protein